MRLVSFDPLRTLDIPGVQTLKAEDWFRAKNEVRAADWVLFPEYWQVNPLTYGWKKRIFPGPASYHLGHDKVEMTRAFEAICPDHLPPTLILPNTERNADLVPAEWGFPFVAKEVRSSMGNGVHLIGDASDWRRYVRTHEVLYAQAYLPIRRDLRVVVIGNRAVAAYWREAAEGNFHNNVAKGGSVSFDGIPDSALTLVERVARDLGIDHAGFDVAEVDGHLYLLEFNVRFGTRALNERGIRLAPLILAYLASQTPPRQLDDPPLRRAV